METEKFMTSEQIKELLNSTNIEDVVLGIRLMGDLYLEIFTNEGHRSVFCNGCGGIAYRFYTIGNRSRNDNYSHCWVLCKDYYVSVNSYDLYLVITDMNIAEKHVSENTKIIYNFREDET